MNPASPRLRRIAGWARSRPALGVFFAAALFGFATGHDVPWTDDARFYVPAAKSHGQWLERVLSFDLDALSRSSVERAFGPNAEHPPVAKFAMGITWLVFAEWLGWSEEVEACRVAIVLLFAAMVAGVFSLLRSSVSAWSAGFGALALTAMPRLLFDAHVETLDLAVAALYLLAAAALWRCLEAPSWWRGVVTVLLFALALGAKLNAPFLLVAALAYVLWCAPTPAARLVTGRGGELTVRLPSIPLVLIGMVLVSPLLTWALWPWLWYDTLARLNTYLVYHLQHYGILFYFRGELYGENVAPWFAPLVMTAITLPVPLALVALAGGVRPALAALARLPWLGRLAPPFGASLATDARLRLGLYALLHAAVQLAIVSLPGVPKYGGVKLFLPLLPFVAVLAGLGFAACERELDVRFAAKPHRRRGLLAATALALLASGWAGAVQYRGVWLSYYNELAGGLRGATAAGYERQYYDLAYPELAEALSARLPRGGAVAVAPNPKEYTPYFARWQKLGLLPKSVRLARADGREADLLVLTHERRWAAYPDLMADARGSVLLYRFAHAGVPLYSVFERRRPPAGPPFDTPATPDLQEPHTGMEDARP